MRDDYYIEIEEDSKKIDLHANNNKDSHKKRKKPSKKLKWGAIFLFIFLIYSFYNSMILFFLDILKQSPALYSQYLFIQSQISNSTLLGLFFVSIFGSLFFLVLPSEALFIYYLNSTNHFFILIIILTVLGSLVGLSFNYFFGKMLGEKILRWMFKKKFDSYKEKILKYGGYVLFFGNIFPGPIEVLTIFYGGFKFEYSRFIYLSMMGRLVKYVLLFILYIYFWDHIIFSYEELLKNFSTVLSVWRS